MEAVGDDQVELLGNVSSIPEALQVLGLSEQEYQQMRASELEGDHSSTGALYAVLKGTQDGPDAEAAKQKEVIRAFHRNYEDSLIQQQKNERHEFTNLTRQALDQTRQTCFRNSDRYMVMTSRGSTLKPASVQRLSPQKTRKNWRSTRDGCTMRR